MQVSSLVVKIGANIQELQSGLSKASKSIENVGKKMTDLGKTVSTRVTAPLTALGAVAVRAFGIQEKAELQLRAALQANGRQVDQLFGRYNAFAQEMQRLTVVGDETTLAMLAQAESFGLTGDAAERAIKNSIAMQSAFGVNAQSALRYTAALEEGNATMLTRYLPSLREIEDESERVAEAQRILGNAFSSAEAEAQGSTGQMIQMKNAVGDLLEVVGGVIAEAIMPLVRRMKELAEQAQTVNPAMIKMGVVIAGVVASIGPLLIVLGSLTKAIAVVLSPLALKLAAITALSLGIVYLAKNLDVLMNRFRVVFATMANVVLKQVDSMLETLGRFFGIFDNKMLVSITSARALLMSLTQDVPEIEGEFQNMGEFIQSVIADLGSAFEWLSNRIFTGSGGVVSATKEVARAFEGATFGASNLSFALNTVVTTAQKIPQSMQDAWVSIQRMAQVSEFARQIATDFTSSFGHGMANVVVQGEKLVDVLKNIGKLLVSSAIQKGLSALLMGGLGGAGFFGAGGGLFGKLFSVNDALITSGGDVVKFHKNDNILAMKDFSGLSGGGSQKVEVFGTIKGQDLFISSQRGSTSWNR